MACSRPRKTLAARTPRAKQSPRRRTRRVHRLPADLHTPTVDLAFELDPEQRTFAGSACYELALERPCRRLLLHAADLRVTHVRLHLDSGTLRGRVEARPESEQIALHFERPLPRGAARLELRFRGRVRRDLRGLYRGGETDAPWLATQLCPTDARRFFPCLDEPGSKSRFRIQVTAPRGLVVISNAPVESETATEDGRCRVRFAETPPLSSYLVAVAVGPFEVSAPRRVGETEIRIVTPPGRQGLGGFAHEVAAASLPRLERWFDVPHPYPKLDLVALPSFAFGAMENAGAVFFRDTVLLLDEALASDEEKKRAAETITHELSHMWFGNLVTMAWWNDLWLNESFATWMAYEILDDWRPEWRIWLDFARRREQALEADALASSHPIAPPVRSADEALENFDAITYTKGACVLRMLQRYLGHETFRAGIQLYVRRHREANARAEDLWSALEEASREPVEAIVGPWTRLTGYPLVSLRGRGRPEADALELRQERFLLCPPRRRPADERTKRRPRPRWPIPWIGRLGSEGEEESERLRALLDRSRLRLDDVLRTRSWIYGNADESGFFRIEHGRAELEALRRHVGELTPVEQIGWLGHQWALTRAGRAPLSDLLELVAALASARDPDVLEALEGVLGRLFQRLAPARGPVVEARLRRWILDRFGERAGADELVGGAGRDAREERRRAALLSLLGGLAGRQDLVDACRARVERHLAEARALPPERARALLRVAAAHADADLQRALIEATRRADTPQDRQRLLFALAEPVEPGLVRRSLAAVDDAHLAPLPDRASLLATMLARPATVGAAWDHLQRRWARLERALPPILLARLVGTLAEALPIERAGEVRAFFAEHPLAAGARVLRQLDESFRIARRLEARAGPELDAYLGAEPVRSGARASAGR